MAANPKRYPRKLSSKDGSLSSIHMTTFAAALDCVSLGQEQACISDSAFLAERGLFTRMDAPRIPTRASLSPGFNQAGEAA